MLSSLLIIRIKCYDKYTIHGLYDYDIIIIFLFSKHSISGRVLVETLSLSDIRTTANLVLDEIKMTTSININGTNSVLRLMFSDHKKEKRKKKIIQRRKSGNLNNKKIYYVLVA